MMLRLMLRGARQLGMPDECAESGAQLPRPKIRRHRPPLKARRQELRPPAQTRRTRTRRQKARPPQTRRPKTRRQKARRRQKTCRQQGPA